ncbi:MAG: response regulator [Chloroflexota bacterium]
MAAVGTAAELLDAMQRLQPNAVIADIRMPPGHHMEGIEAAHPIRARYPTVGVVVLSQHVNAIFAKLDLTEETQVHRRVAAVLAFFRDTGR